MEKYEGSVQEILCTYVSPIYIYINLHMTRLKCY